MPPTIHGVIPPIITPFDADGRIHRLALRELVEWYVAAGCHGLWVCGGTGEGVSLSPNERAEMAELVTEYAAGRLRLVFHVGAASTADAIAAARRCEALEIDAICSVPPFFYGKSDGETLAYFRALGEATDRPLWIYNLPDATGRPLTADLVAGIAAEVPTVAGIKHSGTNLDLVVELLRARPELTVLVGRGELMLAGLVLGARGVVCASLCMAPERFVAVYEAFQADELREAMSRQQHATRVKELYQRFPVIGATKWLNARQIGLDCGPPRGPLAAISAGEEADLWAQAQALGVVGAGGPAIKPAAQRLVPR